MNTTVNLKITAAIAIGGEIIHAGEIIEVSQEAAKNLLHRGRAELATEDDQLDDDDAATADPAEVSPTATATDDAAARPVRSGKPK